MNNSELTSLMYIASFIGTDGNAYCWQEGRSYTTVEMVKLLKLKPPNAYALLSKLSKLGYLSCNGHKVALSDKYFRRGKSPASTDPDFLKSGKLFTRIRCSAVRSLYDGKKKASLTAAGYVFRLIPYVNRYFNVVCKNPLAADLELVEPIPVSEVSAMLGMDVHNAMKAWRRVLKAEVRNMFEDAQPAILMKPSDKPPMKKRYLVVNSLLCYGGPMTVRYEDLLEAIHPQYDIN